MYFSNISISPGVLFTPIAPNQPESQIEFTTPGTYTWIAPEYVDKVSVVAVGAGGGGLSRGTNFGGVGGAGGGLGWKNNISIIPKQSYTVTVGQGYRTSVINVSALDGGSSWFKDPSIVAGHGGQSGQIDSNAGGGGYVGDGGGNGGRGGYNTYRAPQGAGGAGGYSGDGGIGGSNAEATAGSGGGGGGSGSVSSTSGSAASAGGGGVGIYGQGENGAKGGTWNVPGGGGSGGENGQNGVNNSTGQVGVSLTMEGRNGAAYGGGGGGYSGALSTNPAYSARGGHGAVRIIWGPSRAFPSTNTNNV